jgi:hypothetical protein
MSVIIIIIIVIIIIIIFFESLRGVLSLVISSLHRGVYNQFVPVILWQFLELF